MNKSFLADNLEFVFFDVETTGLAPDWGDRAIEYAALRTKGNKEIGRFESLINPDRSISWQATEVNGITNEMVADAPKSPEVISGLMETISQACLVGHNLHFDLNFLNAELKHAGKKPFAPVTSVDTVKLARGLLPQLGRYSLANVAGFLGVSEPQRHRAMADVLMTKKVFFKLLEIAQEKNFASAEILMHLFGVQKTIRQTKGNKMEVIRKVIAASGEVEIIYFGTNSGAAVRKVTPLDICGTGRETAMLGFCHLRGEERNFRLDRIIQVKSI